MPNREQARGRLQLEEDAMSNDEVEAISEIMHRARIGSAFFSRVPELN